MKTPIAINGACGRMGQLLISLAHQDPHLSVVAALDVPGHPNLGRDAGEVAGAGRLGVNIAAELAPATRVDVMVDFSQPQGTMTALKTCLPRRIPLVVATTGHSPEQ